MTDHAFIQHIHKRLDHPLILIGMPAAGKTALGMGLAARLGFDFIDMDRIIEKEQGRKIAEIFAAEGEAAFRAIETETLAAILKLYPRSCVISTGGGVVLRPENREMIFGQGCSIWARASIPVLLERIAADTHHRPLLRDKDPEQVLRALETARIALYREAEIAVDTDRRLPEEILPEIITKIHERLLL